MIQSQVINSAKQKHRFTEHLNERSIQRSRKKWQKKAQDPIELNYLNFTPTKPEKYYHCTSQTVILYDPKT